ncbi:flagellar biosynthetic protein FliR [Aquabacterium sp. A7-Y]|uniref:flagellar biosynthetic protein FliR n=1 Tax=Aquabacterium sp. A7-Y TaxID=1349605 RepID=UPI00223D68AE|nr:flagellar biosynthetic protein FliR [Aquabacterium sp. A7-Y]MCW7536512.1 flagellar biosynthetic protein FliR [Aquabacterium sp. A7-Y]
MELMFSQLVALLSALWWPFCRTLAMLSAAPVVGEAMVPPAPRVLLALVLAVVLLPAAQPAVAIDAFSLRGVAATIEQALIGFGLGLAFHLTMAVVTVLGYMVSSQMGLSMALMNDPMNGSSSDVVSSLLYMLSILVFFAIDGHLVLTGVLGSSFKAWPVGNAGIPLATLQGLALNVAWVFSAALLLALPVIFSTGVVQLGFGFLNRIAPSLNLFSLGFSVVTLFGLFVLSQMVRFIPEHYVRMSERVLQMLHQSLQVGGPHG